MPTRAALRPGIHESGDCSFLCSWRPYSRSSKMKPFLRLLPAVFSHFPLSQNPEIVVKESKILSSIFSLFFVGHSQCAYRFQCVWPFFFYTQTGNECFSPSIRGTVRVTDGLITTNYMLCLALSVKPGTFVIFMNTGSRILLKQWLAVCQLS